MDIIDTVIQQAFHQQSGWEITAVIFGLAYLALAMKQNIWCWFCAFVSTAIYTYVFWHVSLLMDSLLNAYYLVMAIYGYWVWRNKKSTLTNQTIAHTSIPIKKWPLRTHAIVIFCVIFLSTLSGLLLERFSQAAWPFLDSFTTWGSVITTYMVTKKILENWIYWLVIDAVAMVLYIDRGLYFTALLFAVYLVMVIFGFFKWLSEYQKNHINNHDGLSSPSL